MTKEALIFGAIRTPRGRVKRDGGSLAGVKPYRLLSGLFGEAAARGIRPELLDDVIIGVNTQTGEQAGNLARLAAQTAGWDAEISGGTVSRFCSSGLDAIASASAQILSGGADFMLAGGVESMSRVPMASDAPPFTSDSELGEASGFVTIGVAADLLAHRFGLSRAELDDYAVRSHELSLAAPAWRSIVPVRSEAQTAQGAQTAQAAQGGAILLESDEGARPGTTRESLASLPALFSDDPLWDRVGRRFPEIKRPPEGLHTVATAPQLADGASLVAIGSREAGERTGLSAVGRVVSWAHRAVRSPGLWSGELAARDALRRAGLEPGDIDVFEINESFSATPLVFMRQLGIPLERINARGGAVALGHPLGASGGIILANALERLQDEGGRYALLMIPAALGLASAVVIEAFSG